MMRYWIFVYYSHWKYFIFFIIKNIDRNIYILLLNLLIYWSFPGYSIPTMFSVFSYGINFARQLRLSYWGYADANIDHKKQFWLRLLTLNSAKRFLSSFGVCRNDVPKRRSKNFDMSIKINFFINFYT